MTRETPRAQAGNDEEIPLHCGTLASFAYDRIRADILRGRLAPDEKLRIEQMRERYGIGATPLREALNRLAAHGFVELKDRRGFRVVGLSAECLRELTQTRCILETACLRASIARGDETWRQDLSAALTRLLDMERVGPSAQMSEWNARHRTFHATLIGACGSATLLEYAGLHLDQADRYREASAAVLGDRDVNAEHRDIAEAAIAGDADRAGRLLQQHYTRTQNLVLQLLEENSEARE